MVIEKSTQYLLIELMLQKREEKKDVEAGMAQSVQK